MNNVKTKNKKKVDKLSCIMNFHRKKSNIIKI